MTEFKNMKTTELQAIIKSIKYIDEKYIPYIYEEVCRRNSFGIDDWSSELNLISDYI